MAHINLLPWREELRQERQKEFMVMLAIFALLAAVIVGFVHFYNNQLIDYQNSRNQFLDEKIAILDEKIKEIQELEKKKERLLARMEAIQELQGNRPLVVRLFDEVVSSIPDGVSLDKLKQSGRKITINGEAQSNARVSNFMRNLEKSDWLTNPELDIIQADAEDVSRISKFILRFDQVIPTFEGEEEEGEQL